MAFTFSYLDVWNAASSQYARSIDQPALELATNIAINKMWCAYDWRGSVVQLPPFYLVPGVQDYGVPLYDVPTDFYGIREAYLVYVSTSLPLRKKLDIVENLENTHLQDNTQSICYRPSIAGFRVHPRPTFSMAAPLYMIDGTYKKRPPKWTTASYGSQLLFWDDIYFNPFVSACVWAAMKLTGNRQGAMEQYMIFQQDLMEATQFENLELGERVVHPTEGLSNTGANLLFGPW